MPKFRKVAVGGTFDELHKGHRALLLKAFELGERVVIGLTTDEFVSQLSKPHFTASFEKRKQGLISWLDKLGLQERTEVVPLYDAFGSSIQDPDIEALIVSEETKPTAEKINEQRISAGLPKLQIVSIGMVPSENCAPISTTRIRHGEMDREGRLLKRC